MSEFAHTLNNPIDTLFSFEIGNGVSIGCGIPSTPSKPLFTLFTEFGKAPSDDTPKHSAESVEAVPANFVDRPHPLTGQHSDKPLTKIEEEPNYFSDNEEFCSDTTDDYDYNYDEQNDCNHFNNDCAVFPNQNDIATVDIAYETVLPNTFPNVYDFVYPESSTFIMQPFPSNIDPAIIATSNVPFNSYQAANHSAIPPPIPPRFASHHYNNYNHHHHHHGHNSPDAQSQKIDSKLSALAIEFVPKPKYKSKRKYIKKRKSSKPKKPPRRSNTSYYSLYRPTEPPSSPSHESSNDTILALLSNAVKMRLN